VKPPPLDMDDPRHPRFDKRYAHLPPELLPSSESLEDTLQRVLVYWQEVMVPVLQEREEVIVAVHGNSLRALVKHLSHISDEEIPRVEIPTGVPLIYELTGELKPVNCYYLKEVGEQYNLELLRRNLKV